MKKISCKKFQKEMTMKATDEKDVKHTCCFCSADCLLGGNDPDPLAEKGVCCDDCNIAVIFARIGMVKLARCILDKRIMIMNEN